MSGEEPLVTVITPVRNGEPYLAQAIESVLGQTYRNFEYLIVDNASTDESRATAARYAARDARIRVVAETEFLDQISNFNRAVRLMDPGAQYCKFVMADDWLYPECLAEMVRVATRDPEVAIVGALRYAGDKIKCVGLPGPEGPDLVSIVEGRAVGRAYLLDNVHLFGSPTSVLFRADVVRSRPHFFPLEGPNHDTDLCLRLLASARFGFVHRVLTFSRTANDSVSSGTRRYDPGFRVSRLIMLGRHGGTYLTAVEEQVLRSVLERDLYRFMARGVLKTGRRAFLAHHEAAMAEAKLELRRGRLALAVARQLLVSLVHPISAARAGRLRLRQLRARVGTRP